MRNLIFIITFFSAFSVYAQQKEVDFDAIDSLYREDQFYVNITYNTLQKRPDGIGISKFSPGFSFGFIRDMPINKKRTISIAASLGYTLSILNNNIGISNVNGENVYQVLGEDTAFNKNKLSLHYIDIPIEFRWRNSTFQSHKFWRVYGGVKLSYLIADKYKFTTPSSELKLSNNKDLNNFNYGLYLATGWNTWNFYAYYGLNPLFKSSATLNDKSIDMNALNFGLMFYIL